MCGNDDASGAGEQLSGAFEVYQRVRDATANAFDPDENFDDEDWVRGFLGVALSVAEGLEVPKRVVVEMVMAWAFPVPE